MHKIFIDSTEFKAEPARLSKTFGQLTELTICDFVEIHLSRINVDEIESAIADQIKKHELSMLEAITKASSFGLSEPHYSSVESHLKLNADWFKRIADDAINEFKLWLKKTKALVHEISHGDGENVMKSYFSGMPPFRHPKERNDIPDAFIWETIKRLSAESGDIYFISADKVFREKVKNHFQNIKTYSNLKELFEQPEIIKIVDEWESFTKQAFTEGLIEMIESELKLQEKDLQEELTRQIQDHLIGNQIIGRRGASNGEITEVRFIERPEIELDYVQITEFPKLYFTFDIEVEVTISLALPLWEIDQSRNDSDQYQFDRIIPNDDNSTDTHFIAENYKFTRVYGEALIELPTLNSGSGKEDVIDAVEECEIRISKIKMEMLS